jgi:hypothetical protein
VYLAAILFIIDVAVRRLSLEWNARPKAELVRDTARVTAAWRHARASARGEVPFAAPHAAGDGGAAAGESRDVASAAVAESTASPTRPAMPQAEEPEDESPMGRLRAAKRRARGGSS